MVGAGEELGGEEGGGKQRDHLRRHLKLPLRIQRQDGQDQRRAQHLHKDDQQNCQQPSVD